MNARTSRAWPLALLLVPALAAWIDYRVETGLRLEDALITYRYAENLAGGHGFVYNLGERVQGTTTPLLTLLLGAWGILFGPRSVGLGSNVLMMAAGAGAVVFAVSSLRRAELPRSALISCGALIALNRAIVWSIAGGMETPLVLLLMAGSLWAVVRERPTLAAALAALLVLTRVDGLIWAAGIFALLAFADRTEPRRLLRPLLVFAAIVGLWGASATLYFGQPLPNSLLAKKVIGPSPLPLFQRLRWLEECFDLALPLPSRVNKLLGLALFGLGVLRLRRAPRALLLWALFAPLFVLIFALGGAPYFLWYFIPARFAVLVTAACGVGWLLERLPPRWSQTAALIPAALALLLGINLSRDLVLQRAQQQSEETRKEVGLWLRDATAPDASVAMEAIGYQGYYAERRVIDLAGLISPAVVRIRASSRSNAEAFARILAELKPDYLVLRSFEVEQNRHFHGGPLFEGDGAQRFRDTYEEAARFEAPAGDEELRRLTIFRRIVPVRD